MDNLWTCQLFPQNRCEKNVEDLPPKSRARAANSSCHFQALRRSNLDESLHALLPPWAAPVGAGGKKVRDDVERSEDFTPMGWINFGYD